MEDVVLVGAGFTSNTVFDLLKAEKRNVVRVVDNDSRLWGTMHAKSRLMIEPVDYLVGESRPVIIAAAGGGALRTQLLGMGLGELDYRFNFVASCAKYKKYWSESEWVFPRVLSSLTDNRSRCVFTSMVNAAVVGKTLDLDLVNPDAYWGSGCYEIQPDESVIEAGIGLGSALRALSQQDMARMSGFLALEPDTHSATLIQDSLDSPETRYHEFRDKFEVRVLAVGSQDSLGDLSERGVSTVVVTRSSMVEDQDTQHSVNVRSLDSLVANDGRPKLVALDIEGMEIEAIKGATALMDAGNTRFAISVYHDPNHLVEAMDLFERSEVNYSFGFRLHDYGFCDQVLYAWPWGDAGLVDSD